MEVYEIIGVYGDTIELLEVNTLNTKVIKKTALGRYNIGSLQKPVVNKKVIFKDKYFCILIHNNGDNLVFNILGVGCCTPCYSFCSLEGLNKPSVKVVRHDDCMCYQIDIFDNDKGYSVVLHALTEKIIKPIFQDRYFCKKGSTLKHVSGLNFMRIHRVTNKEEAAASYAEHYGIINYRVVGYKIIYNKSSASQHITWQHEVDLRTMEHTSRTLSRYDKKGEYNGV